MDSVTVVVVNWNGRSFISSCLEGLRGQTYGGSWTTIVVDNGSTDGSVEFLSNAFPEIDIIELSENVGFAKANNIAIKSVQSPHVALLNNDAVPEPDWLAHLVESLERFPEAGMAASKMVYFSAPDRIDRAGDAYTLAGAGSLRGRGKPADTYDKEEWIFGACAGAALYRTRMLQELGGFDEDFFLLYEDVDLSFRAQLAGFKCVYVPKAVVRHMATRSIGYDSPMSVYYGHRNLEWVYVKNMPRRLLALTFPLHLLYVTASFLFFSMTGNGKVYLKAKIDALRAMRLFLEKRKRIQERRLVSDDDIRGLLSFELLGDRFFRRLKGGKPTKGSAGKP